MELKATLAAEGGFLSSTVQVDKNNKHYSGFFVSHGVKPTGGLPDAVIPSETQPKSDHKQVNATAAELMSTRKIGVASWFSLLCCFWQ